MKIKGKLHDVNLTGSGLSSVSIVLDDKGARAVLSVPFALAAELAPLMLKEVTITVEETPAAA